MITVLGISPGTRHIGIAIFRKQELIDWRTLSFSDSWSKEKLKEMVSKIDKIVTEHHIERIALKVPHIKRCSRALQSLIWALRRLFREKGTEVLIIAIGYLKKHFNQPNKEKLSEFLASKELVLHKLYSKNLISQNGYYTRMFEAIAAGHSIL